MTQPSIPQERVETIAARYFMPRLHGDPYAAFAGLVEGIVTDEELTDTQQVEEIRAGLAALDMTLARRRALLVPHGPVRPPYGSTARERVDRIAPIADEQAD